MIDPDQKLPRHIEVYELGARRLYAKTIGRSFALFEDELTPEELIAIARDIIDRQKLINKEDCTESSPASDSIGTKCECCDAFDTSVGRILRFFAVIGVVVER